MANIKVAVRVRPISAREIHLTGSDIVVQTEPKTVSLTNLKVSSNKAGDSRERTRRYGFDYCFDSSDPRSENYASQETIYETLGEIILDALFKRYNSCLIAYGQSSSGKTYTMMGSKEDPGITPRVCEGLFLRLADEEKSNGSFHVSVSYLEVYNERVRDLLNPSSNCVGLKVREHPRLGPYVQGLTHHAVPTLGSLISRVEEGTRARKTASTLQNPTSSRSHALLTLSLQPTSDNSGQSAAVPTTTSGRVPGRNDFPRGSNLHLVDLAGSESAAACGGVNRLKEGANINKSLVALGNVISALADRGLPKSSPGRRFIPYRDSALTWLLKDVLGGNATTVMLATISPASGSYNETSHTLRFAQRAQSVINRPVINEDPVSRIIRELRAEVARLKSLLLEKNINIAVNSTSVGPRCGDQQQDIKDEEPEIRTVVCIEPAENNEEPIEINELKVLDQSNGDTERPTNESRGCVETSSCLEPVQQPKVSSCDLDSGKYNEAKVSEIFVNDEVDEPVYVDIPTLVAVLIKPDDNVQANSHQIEEICSDGVTEDGNDIEFPKNVEGHIPSKINSPSKYPIERRQSEDYRTGVVHNREQFPSNNGGSVERLNRQKIKTKFRKQDSIDGDRSSKSSSNLQSVRKYGSIDSLPRRTENVWPIARSNTNLDKRNSGLDKIKKLNNIKEVDDRKSSRVKNSCKNSGTWNSKDSQKRGSSDSEKSLKNFCPKPGSQPTKRNNDGLTRKPSKDSSSSGSKDELATPPDETPLVKGASVEEQIPPRVHTPIQRASRAEIVTAVTERLYSSKKNSEDGNTATTITTTSTPASEVRSPESTDVKLAAATRMRLQEISRKMLAKRRKICVDTQTDSQKTLRVRDTASLTDVPNVISKDASMLTDRHEDYETLPSTSFAVLRVKETSTFTEPIVQGPVVRCKDAGIITDHYYADYPSINSPRNDSGIMSDDMPNYSRSDFSNGDSCDLGGNVDRRSVVSVDNSTNTITLSGPFDSGSQTRRDDLIETRCRCCEASCCAQTNHCHGSNSMNHAERDQSYRHADKNVISISLPDMVSITIESSNGLESKIKVYDGIESMDEPAAISSKDNEVQTDARNAVEMSTSTDDIFGRICFDDFSSPAKPFVPQTDGKTFRIENIFHKTGSPATIKPRIEIVPDSSRKDEGSRGLTVTNSVGTIFVPETRENATGMEKSTNYSLTERFGTSAHRISMKNDLFVKNTWPGQWTRRVSDLRRKCNRPASIDEYHRSLPEIQIAPFDRANGSSVSDEQRKTRQRSFGCNENESYVHATIFEKKKPSRNYAEKLASRINEGDEGSIDISKSLFATSTTDDGGGLEYDTNFSDDSLDQMEDNVEEIRGDVNLGNKRNSKTTNLIEENVSEQACPPDVVAHTKKDNNESSTVNNNVIESEDFEDSQQIVFPKVKLETNVPTSFTTPISDFKSLILGDVCCLVNQVDESNFHDSGDTSTVGVLPQDSTVSHSNDDEYCGRSDELKSIIKKPSQRRPKSQVSENGPSLNFASKKLKRQCSHTRKVHFAVPEVFELTSSDSEAEVSTSDDDSVDDRVQNIFEDYVDEAVILMRSVNSMNEYISAARAFDKFANKDRNRRSGKAKGSNYIEYDGRRIELDDESVRNDNSEDEYLDFNADSYGECLRSMDRLEECLAKIKRHDEILRSKYGIKVDKSTGAKLDLAKSSVDSKESNESLKDENTVEHSRTRTQSRSKAVTVVSESVDGDNNNLPRRKNDSKHLKTDGDGPTEISESSQSYGFRKFHDTRQKDITAYFQFRGRNCDSEVDTGIKKKEKNTDANLEFTETNDSVGTRGADNLQNPSCYLALPNTKRVVTNISEGIKSSTARPRFSLSKYESFDDSSSSNEALESFMESIDNATRSTDKFKYPGSPRSKFLQLLTERRRIVENTRNTGVS